MSSIERQISITRGPFFFEEDGKLMFQFACDNSTVIGPYLAKPNHIAEYDAAYKAFQDAKAAGQNPEPEFVMRERRDKPKQGGRSVFDMINGASDEPAQKQPQTYVPGVTNYLNVGPGGRKADPVTDTVTDMAKPAEPVIIAAEAKRPPGRPRKVT